MTGALRQYAHLIRTAILHAFGVSDRAKWKKFNFPREWEERLQRIAVMIPAGSDVFEFGAGPVGLRPFLDRTCRLTSSDLVVRDEHTVVLDLNHRPLPNLDVPTDIAVLAGVLEYISDLASLLAWLAKNFTTCIVTYADMPVLRGGERMREVVGRTHMGWANHLSENELVQLFTEAGFRLVTRECWNDQDPETIFVFGMDTQP